MEIGAYSTHVTGASLREKMASLKALGYDFIELALGKEEVAKLGPELAASVRADAEAAGLPVRSATLGTFPEFLDKCTDDARRKDALEEIRRACELLSALGGDTLLLPAWDGSPADDGFTVYGRALGEVAPRAADLGVRLAVEHIPSSKFVATAAGVARIAEAADHPAVGVYLDIGNALSAGEDPVAAIKEVGARVLAVHFKGLGDRRPLGAMPLDEVRIALEHVDFQGRGAVEMRGGENNEVLKGALETLRSHGI